MNLKVLLSLIIVFSMSCSHVAYAHKLAPSLLALTETDANSFSITWKTPQLAPQASKLTPKLPSHCQQTSQLKRTIEGTGILSQWQISCNGTLQDSVISIAALAQSRTAALLRIKWLSGETLKAMLTDDKPVYRIPKQLGKGSIALDYIELGAEHILSGVDHLLFVLGLIFLVSGRRLLIETITAFTVGHSITLALAALGYVSYPVDLVELAIAASIFVIAVELTRVTKEPSILRRKPWLVALCFGLLHGMGFAGGLLEVGLPATEIPLALLVFNIGIEAGQLAFIAIVFAGMWVLGRLNLLRYQWLKWIPIYAIGSMSAFWCIQRAIPLFQ